MLASSDTIQYWCITSTHRTEYRVKVLHMVNCPMYHRATPKVPIFVCSNSIVQPSHFSHPSLGIYEVQQFLDLGYLEGTIPGWYMSSISIPWNGKPIPYPTHSNTMSLTIPCHLIPYHLTSYHTIRGVWGPFYKI